MIMLYRPLCNLLRKFNNFYNFSAIFALTVWTIFRLVYCFVTWKLVSIFTRESGDLSFKQD